MKLAVERLREEPTSFAFEGGSTWWARCSPQSADLPRAPAEPLRFVGQAHSMGEGVYLEGSVEGCFELECSRCLARYRHGVHEGLRLVLEPAGVRVPSDPEAAESLARDGLCLGDELDTGWFRGKEIHLGSFFFEIVSLALPVKPLCREECPGLCPRCGVNRSVQSCECSEVKPDSPFAVLATLRRDPTGERD